VLTFVAHYSRQGIWLRQAGNVASAEWKKKMCEFEIKRKCHWRVDPRPVLFILGAEDPEMGRISELIEQAGMKFCYATSGGRRVHPGNAYMADLPESLQGIDFRYGDELVLIECGLRESIPSRLLKVIVLDHHRPGDPGFGLGPEQYWDASSLGQLYKLFKKYRADPVPRPEDLVLAAMDHCFTEALRGKCPDVTREAVLSVKYREIAASTKAGKERVEETVGNFTTKIVCTTTPNLRIGNVSIVDLRTEDLGVGYSLDLLCAQVASALVEKPVLLSHRDTEGGPQKVTLYGAPTEAIKVFMSNWAPAQGLAKIYGVPDRGYAGGYYLT